MRPRSLAFALSLAAVVAAPAALAEEPAKEAAPKAETTKKPKRRVEKKEEAKKEEAKQEAAKKESQAKHDAGDVTIAAKPLRPIVQVVLQKQPLQFKLAPLVDPTGRAVE